MDLKLKYKTALVTGSTAGIGLEIARALAIEEARVFVVGRTAEKVDRAVRDIEQSGGKVAFGIVADPATSEGAATILETAAAVDIVVNNLGIYEIAPFSEISDDEWHRFFEVNVVSGIRLAREYFKGMISRGWGRIIFVSSESGVMTPRDMIHYGTTKTAQIAVAHGLAQLTRGTEVTVNTILPGPTRSEGIVEFLRSSSDNPSASAAELEAEFFAKHRPSSLLQRLIEPEEIASLAAFLASPLSSATNGAALRVEGGLIPSIL
jgi:NAD(P)-dependent dehydrogenase (short-subunit alcohol dehydrogenase family)